MATYNNSVKRTYYTVAKGKFNHRDKDGNISTFTGIDGVLKDIILRDGKVNGTDKTFVDFVLEDAGEQLVVSAGLYDGVANTILRCLINVENLKGKLLLETWSSDRDGKTYTNIAVKMDGNRVQWCNIPDIEEFTLPTGEVVKSAKKREEFIDGIIERLQAKLRGKAEAEPREGLVVDDDIPEADAEYQPNIG